jgi:hypothetical protein
MTRRAASQNLRFWCCRFHPIRECCIPRWDPSAERILINSDGLASAPMVRVTSHVALAGPRAG